MSTVVVVVVVVLLVDAVLDGLAGAVFFLASASSLDFWDVCFSTAQVPVCLDKGESAVRAEKALETY